jgi:hypothetical protein
MCSVHDTGGQVADILTFDADRRRQHDSAMKTGLFVHLYRKLGEGLGLLEDRQDADAARSDDDVREALLAVEKLRQFQLKMRKAGVTRKDVRRWINEGRRV